MWEEMGRLIAETMVRIKGGVLGEI
jgi:hypothetical protein